MPDPSQQEHIQESKVPVVTIQSAIEISEYDWIDAGNKGMKIPKEKQIIGGCDTAFCTVSNPALSIIDF